MKYDIKNDIEINPFRLKDECVSHTGLYYKYSDACADAKQNVSIAKDKYDVIMAERELAIRQECADNGKKVTEKIIESMVKSDSEVIEARDELREVEGIYAKLQVAVNAMETRRSELDNLVKLAVSNHYSTVDKSDGGFDEDKLAKHELHKLMNKERNYD